MLGILIGATMIYSTNTLNEQAFKINNENLKIPNSLDDISNNCKNFDIINTSRCFRDYVSTFFKYDSDNIYYILEDNEFKIETITSKSSASYSSTNREIVDYLKENGGNCREWSLLYYLLCKKTNYQCSQISNDGIVGIFDGHRYAVIYNETHYCKLDQLSVKCSEIENDE